MTFAKNNLVTAKTDILESALKLLPFIKDETFADVIVSFQKLVETIEQRLNQIITRVDLSGYEDFVEYADALSVEVDALKELSDAGYKVCVFNLNSLIHVCF